MRALAFLFPGQGMEAPRMGLALAARCPAAKALLEEAGRACGVDLERLLWRGGRDLERTEVLQPAITAVALGAHAALRSAGLAPDVVAGHSLGELAAWSAAGGVSAEEAVRLAALRGALMSRQVAQGGGRMLAVLGPRDVAEQALEMAQRHGDATLAAHNAPEEWVLSGEERALTPLLARFPARFLSVGGAWHGPALAGAVDELREALARAAGATEPRSGDEAAAPARPIRFLGNRRGAEVAPRDAPDQLAEQLVRPVRWAATLEALPTLGVTDVVTVGPGKVLRGLLRKNLGDALRLHTTEDPDDLDRTVERLETWRQTR